MVLVGHSMGGMTIIALAEQHPELFGDRVIGVGLISTTAGGLDPSRILLPMVPARLTAAVTQPRGPHLARRHRIVDWLRRAGPRRGIVATDSSPSATTCRLHTSTSSTRCSRPPRSR